MQHTGTDPLNKRKGCVGGCCVSRTGTASVPDATTEALINRDLEVRPQGTPTVIIHLGPTLGILLCHRTITISNQIIFHYSIEHAIRTFKLELLSTA